MHLRTKWRKALVWALVVGGGLMLWLTVERVRGELGLRRWRETMRARGQGLSVAELLPPVPPGRTPLSPDAVATLLHLTDLDAVALQCVRSAPHLAPGTARVVWGEPADAVVPWSTNTWSHLAEHLGPVAEVLAEVRSRLLDRSWVIVHEYSRGPGTPRIEVFPILTAGQTLSAQAHLDLQHQRLEAACENLRALLALPEEGISGHDLLGHAVATSIGFVAVPPTWQVLQASGWTDAQLATLQTAWEGKHPLEDLARCLAVERAVVGDGSFEEARTNISRFLEELGNGPFPVAPPLRTDSPLEATLETVTARGARVRTYVQTAIWRQAWLAQAQLHYSRRVQAAIDYVRSIASDRSLAAVRTRWGSADHLGEALQAWRADRPTLAGWYDRIRYWASVRLLPRFEEAIETTTSLETARSLVVAAIALHRHRLRHGRPAPSLEALVPEFLPRVPTDFMDGKPIRYRLAADGTFLLYSVGQDGRDDGGATAPSTPAAGPPSLWDGPDWVWPRPDTTAAEGVRRSR